MDYGDVSDTVTPEPAESESALGTRLLKRTSPYMRGDDVRALQTIDYAPKHGRSGVGRSDLSFEINDDRQIAICEEENELKI